MSQDTTNNPSEDKDVIEYLEGRLFENSFDSLDSFIQRKKALAHPERYAVLFYMYETTENGERVPRQELGEVTNRHTTGNDLQTVLRPLLDANLIAKIPAPDGGDGRQTYYRITTLGRDAIGSDRRILTDD